MMAQDWILFILVGGLLGTVGQGIRVIVGLKKLYDSALQEGTIFSDVFRGSTLFFSLLVGFVAGVLGILSIAELEPVKIGKDQALMLIGFGYAGADFIEGFVRKNTSRFNAVNRGTAVVSVSGKDNQEQPAVG